VDTFEIRKAVEADWNQIWQIVHEVFSRGDTYAYAPETDKEQGHKIWMESPTVTYAAVEGEVILGTYYIKPNQPGLGAHVCNAGYMVGSNARGKGIGRTMCAHSLKEAVKLGFKAMQYNLVAATNAYAVKLWQEMGFEIIGTLPKAFNHKTKGLVDAYVMYQLLS
jgi:L-amino acid N-acyltransferase YncA